MKKWLLAALWTIICILTSSAKSLAEPVADSGGTAIPRGCESAYYDFEVNCLQFFNESQCRIAMTNLTLACGIGNPSFVQSNLIDLYLLVCASGIGQIASDPFCRNLSNGIVQLNAAVQLRKLFEKD